MAFKFFKYVDEAVEFIPNAILFDFSLELSDSPASSFLIILSNCFE